MQLEAPVEPLVVAVERVRVFHYELADADETRAGPRLVAVLGLEVVEHLRQVAVRLDLARVEGGCLLVRHRQDELSVVPIAELEDFGNRVAARRFPELGRRQYRHQHLLCPDRVHLLADDLDDLLVDAPAEG